MPNTQGTFVPKNNPSSQAPKLINRANQWPKICLDSLVDDAGLSASAFRVYLHLWRRGDNETHVSWPGIDSIASTCRLHKTTVLGAIKELEELRFIKVLRRRGRQSNYEILPKQCWVNPPAFNQSEIDNAPLSKSDHTVIQKRPVPLSKNDHHQSEIDNVRYPIELNPRTYPKKAEPHLGWAKDKNQKEYLSSDQSPDPKQQGSVARLAKDFLKSLRP